MVTPEIPNNSMSFCVRLYERSYSALDIMNLLEDKLRHACSSIVIGAIKVKIYIK